MLAEEKLKALQANSRSVATCTDFQDISIELVERRKII